MKGVARTEESFGTQLFIGVTSAGDDTFGQGKPMPQAKTFIALELLPGSGGISRRNMSLAKMAVHRGIKLCSSVQRATASGAALN